MNQSQFNMQSPGEVDRNYVIRADRKPVTIGYVRIGPVDPGHQVRTRGIYQYADYYGWTIDGIVFEKISGMTSWQNRRELKWLVDALKAEDRLLVEELSQIGRNVPDVVNLIAKLHEKGTALCDVGNKWQIDAMISSQMIAMFHAIANQIDRGHVSMRTREGLAARKAKGLKLGRKKGGIALSKLDRYKTDIISLLKSGSTKAYIMKKYTTSKTNLYHWLKKNKLEEISPEFDKPPIV